ncbi:MAG: FkbM family methyltransferase [Hyphomicrobiaceae bacterium]|nr:FkbM family methyltransferase [Hyphomicrobiaceae bacterium]
MSKLVYSISKRLNRLRPFPSLVSRRGATFLLDPRDWIDNRLIAGAPFENEQLAFAEKLVRDERLTTFFDIGANFGLYTVLLGRLPQIDRIIAFEPVRRSFAQLMGNVFANELSAKVDAHQIALGSTSAEATIHIDPRSHGLARIDLAGADRDLSVFSQSETISVRRFDDIVSLRSQRCLVKIDVEGAVAGVLAGMQRFLASNDVWLQIELLDSELSAVPSLLAEANFREFARIDRDTYFRKVS